VLLSWLNDFFNAGYTKVEQMSNGAMACQIMDAIYPGKVPLQKVNFDARTQPECVANFKVLQSVFDKESIPKYIDVPKLLNAKFQDNLEFLQWLKQYFDKNYAGQEYNAVERKEWARAQYKKGHKFAGGARTSGPSAAAPASKPVTKPAAAPVRTKPAVAAKPTVTSTSTASKKSPPVGGRTVNNAAQSTAADESAAVIAQMQATMEGLEKERGFYFGKLREIEIMCQDENAEVDVAKLKEQILNILYQTDDNAEFQPPDENDLEQQFDDQQLDEPVEQGLLDSEELQDTY
jgi:RP/EB family microtubule-associated protein